MNEKMSKVWDGICQEVERNVQRTYLSIPLGKRKQLGVEPGKDGKFIDEDNYDRNRWMVCYINMLEWQRKAWQIFAAENRDDKNT